MDGRKGQCKIGRDFHRFPLDPCLHSWVQFWIGERFYAYKSLKNGFATVDALAMLDTIAPFFLLSCCSLLCLTRNLASALLALILAEMTIASSSMHQLANDRSYVTTKEDRSAISLSSQESKSSHRPALISARPGAQCAVKRMR